ncbi:MAG: hypothetical protein JRG97_11460 [Deltaproteobacteria bacterium]|nr:hypothetical protein [Deltaproteobacteria bacterium]MBW2053033.1 hypothetical protein [Deltaproteobacteria bacterium]MBW2141670.1 hypothetical protein [Deltaproteobacteria bacterium]MBW2323188.1 hypothetical protein [Deltaproteobacteria bacterium]
MARIKIKDLPANQAVSKDELKKVMGGVYAATSFDSLASFDFGSLSVIAGCGCRSMPSNPKEAGC